MPYIRVEAFEGRTQEQKRKLAKAITDSVADIFKADKEGIRIVFVDVNPTDYAQGGKLWPDRTTP